jgi:hypothetical protein
LNKINYLTPLDTIPTDTSRVNISESIEKKKINIYPNPSSDNITIEYNGFEKDFLVELFDFSGKLVETKTMNSTISYLNLNNFPNGFYTLKIENSYFKILLE